MALGKAIVLTPCDENDIRLLDGFFDSCIVSGANLFSATNEAIRLNEGELINDYKALDT
ncbi:hypothetical protein GCM10009113_34330 [Marinobacter szutsaonensis]